MASVNEQLIREYFEAHGFLVRQPVKYQVAARKKRDDEETDFLILRPGGEGIAGLPSKMIWGAEELRQVRCAAVSVRGWHTDRFSPALIEANPDLCRFAEPALLEAASAELGSGPVVAILCLSGFPGTPGMEADALAMLKDRNISGVLTFETVLLELLETVDVSKNYEKSDLMQTLRILKAYDVIKEPQLELFTRRRRAGSRN